MLVIDARNVNDAWWQAKMFLNGTHITRPSRVGEVLEYPGPVTTLYRNPTERVLFDRARNANPFFHIFEALWMLAGRDDVAWIAQFNPRMHEFSDDGVILHGAYGHRWRRAFDLDGGAEDGYADQLAKVIRMLKKSPDERRAVVAMWNPIWDLERPDVKDVPCNTNIYFKIRDGKLTMTVSCRSNDVVWGAYGANAVHMSMLQEYIAAMVGVPVGPYWQMSDSWHAYTERWDKFGGRETNLGCDDPYAMAIVKPLRMVTVPEKWDEELQLWVSDVESHNGDIRIYANSFFCCVAEPLLNAWRAYKSDNTALAKQYASKCYATDWRRAALQWLERIEAKRAVKKAGVTA